MQSRLDQLQLLVIETRPGTRDRVAARLQRHPAVRYAEPEFTVVATGAPAPSDPMARDQWNLTKVQAPEAWELLPPGARTIVAVLDTGIDYSHPDFAGQISSAACDSYARRCVGLGATLGGSPNPPMDLNGHGSHVAGIIGAATDNGTGVASITGGRVTILPIRVLNRAGGTVDAATYLDAIVYAVDQGAKVINMSFGPACGREAFEAYRDAISYADNRGVLIVTSAGNTGTCNIGRYPGTDPRVLTVAATDAADQMPSWSDKGHWVSVAAPGRRILSTVPMSQGGYTTYSGTSMATPHVAAQAALLYQVPGATKTQVMEWIKSTCDPLPIVVQCGGRINVYRSVHLAMTGIDPGKQPAPTATSEDLATNPPASSDDDD